MSGARRILEVGTLGGYSTIWLVRALPADGRLITLELDPHHAQVARRDLDRAGLAGRVEVRVGPAAASPTQMQADGEAPFDLAFIGADKEGYVDYLEKAVPLVRPSDPSWATTRCLTRFWTRRATAAPSATTPPWSRTPT